MAHSYKNSNRPHVGGSEKKGMIYLRLSNGQFYPFTINQADDGGWVYPSTMPHVKYPEPLVYPGWCRMTDGLSETQHEQAIQKGLINATR